jgi:hypothetical protein
MNTRRELLAVPVFGRTARDRRREASAPSLRMDAVDTIAPQRCIS